MKRLVITAVAVAAMAAGAGVAVHVTGSQNDPIFEANVEALTRGEGSESITCEAPWDPVCTTLGNLVISGTRVR